MTTLSLDTCEYSVLTNMSHRNFSLQAIDRILNTGTDDSATAGAAEYPRTSVGMAPPPPMLPPQVPWDATRFTALHSSFVSHHVLLRWSLVNIYWLYIGGVQHLITGWPKK